ncbi:MAG: tetratricopeptide repeat protein [Myxococcota bacterium]
MAKQPKRMSRKELKRPDEVEVALKGMWGFIERHWRVMVGVAVALLVIGAATSIFGRMQKSDKETQAAALQKALVPLASPIGEEAPAAQKIAGQEVFPTADAARKASSERLAAFISEHPDAVKSSGIALLQASLGADGATADPAALQKWIADNEKSSLASVARFQLGQSQERAGQKAEALASYRAVADASQGIVKAMALMAIGDLHNPMAGGSGDPSAAREAYTAARDALGPRPKADPDDILALSLGQPYIFAELQTKLALLE